VGVLITGAGGLVGGALTQTGEAVGLSREALDITDTAAFQRALEQYQPAAVINAAAQANVDRADTEPEWTAAVNAIAPTALAAIAARHGVRFVHLSTDYVLDAPHLASLDEAVEPSPRSTYAETKLHGERGVLEADGVVVRLQWVYQPGHRGFFNRALSMMASGQAVRLVSDQVGCPTPASLIAPALLRIAAGEGTGLFHLATTGEATAAEWITAGARAAGIQVLAEPAIRADFTGAHRPARSVLNCDKLAEAYGIRLPDWTAALQTVMPEDDKLWTGVLL
jgi:dTDP-4-dehydrorhamnose reductase